MRMACMLSRCRGRPVRPTRIGDPSVTHRVRHHGRHDTRAIVGVRPLALDRYRVVTSVAAVTGVAHALPRTASVPAPSPEVPAATEAPPAAPAIRAVPSVRPAPTPRRRVPAPSATRRRRRHPPAPSAPAGRARARARRRRRPARGPGRRELRRQETRARIVDAAAELFAERGFDAVSVMEIARRAGVVEKTVFNHFPVKEGLVFDADPPMRAALLDAVRRRPAGESVSAAAGSFVVAAVSLLGSPEAADRRRRDGAGHPREPHPAGARAGDPRRADERARRADRRGDAARARGRSSRGWPRTPCWGCTRRCWSWRATGSSPGSTGPELSAELRRQGRRGLALLQFGLAGYAKRR